MTAAKPEHLSLASVFESEAATPAPITPSRRNGGFFRRHRRPSASSSTVSSTPTFFSSTRSRASHFGTSGPLPIGESPSCGCQCRAKAAEAEALLCCLTALLRRRAEPCQGCDGGKEVECPLVLPRPVSTRSSRHCLFDGGSGSSSRQADADFALLDLRPQPPPLPPRRRHHSLGSAHAWVHPSLGPPQLPPRPSAGGLLPRCLPQVYACPFYWGRLDARRAELALANAKSGTFLLRDSSHADYLFTLSYRWAEEIKHFRIEFLNVAQRFALDVHSHFSHECPAELVLHYRDRRLHLDGTALLLQPLTRPSAFSLAALCRAAVCGRVRRSGDLERLHLPPALVAYLRAYCLPTIPTIRSKPAPP